MTTIDDQLAAGILHHRTGRLEEAESIYRQILKSVPNCTEAWNQLGVLACQLGQLETAAEYIQYSLEIKPDYAEACCNLGSVLRELSELDQAVILCRRAIALKPEFVEAHSNLGLALHEQGAFSEAAACFDRALQLNPDFATAHWNRSLLMLLRGDFERGWPEFEWRWRCQEFGQTRFPEPMWDGCDLTGKTILLHAEMGLGDTIQFVRYVDLVKRLGAEVNLECQRPLLKLLESQRDIDRLIGAGDELPAFDFHAPLPSLPGIFKTSLNTIPANVPNLTADAGLVAHWRQRLEPIAGFRIGINWRGREDSLAARRRDIPLDLFSTLAQMPGVRLISLQKGSGRNELAAAQERLPIVDPGEDLDTAHGAFMDSAAIMMNLDLVITSDTSVPHLAGALGGPVWVALPYVPDWRWLLARADSPWYPTMRLFRQDKPGDWTGVFEKIESALREYR